MVVLQDSVTYNDRETLIAPYDGVLGILVLFKYSHPSHGTF